MGGLAQCGPVLSGSVNGTRWHSRISTRACAAVVLSDMAWSDDKSLYLISLWVDEPPRVSWRDVTRTKKYFLD